MHSLFKIIIIKETCIALFFKAIERRFTLRDVGSEINKRQKAITHSAGFMEGLRGGSREQMGVDWKESLILRLVWWETGSQRRSFRPGAVWCQGSVWVRTRARAVRTSGTSLLIYQWNQHWRGAAVVQTGATVVERGFDNWAVLRFEGEGWGRGWDTVAWLGGGGDSGATDGGFAEGRFWGNEKEFSFVNVEFEDTYIAPLLFS